MTLLELIYRFPMLKKPFWRLTYNIFGKYYSNDHFQYFMNYGYINQDKEKSLNLKSEDEGERLSIQLYYHLLSQIEINQKDVLEVGCGNGGGVKFIADYLSPHTVYGLDLSKSTIANCRKLNLPSNVFFDIGDATKMPYSDEKFDVVVNIESSHCYNDFPLFLKEVRRVLKPGGYFLFADLRVILDIEKFQQDIANSKFQIVYDEDITTEVLAAMHLNSALRKDFVEKRSPYILKNFLMAFTGVEDTQVHTLMSEGLIKYFGYILQK